MIIGNDNLDDYNEVARPLDSSHTDCGLPEFLLIDMEYETITLKSNSTEWQIIGK